LLPWELEFTNWSALARFVWEYQVSGLAKVFGEFSSTTVLALVVRLLKTISSQIGAHPSHGHLRLRFAKSFWIVFKSDSGNHTVRENSPSLARKPS
jgi:hypothetical protein